MIKLENDDTYVREMYEFEFLLRDSSFNRPFYNLQVIATDFLLNYKARFIFRLFFDEKYNYVLTYNFLILLCEFVEKKLIEHIDDEDLIVYMETKLANFERYVSIIENTSFQFGVLRFSNDNFSISCDLK